MDINIKDFEWKPMLSSEMTLFDRLGQEFKAHPIIILEFQDKIYFLKSQSAKYKIDPKTKKLLIDEETKSPILIDRDKELIESNKVVLVCPYENQPTIANHKIYFTSDSLVDTSQIFVMSKNDFIDYFGSKELLDNVNYYTRTLRYSDRERILEHLINNIDNDNYSITLISRENGIDFRPKLIYSSQNLIDEERNKALKDINKGAKIDLNKIDTYLNTYKNDYTKNKDKIESDVEAFRKFLKDTVLEEIYSMSNSLQQNNIDREFYHLENVKLKNKYSDEEIYIKWVEDVDRKDERFNLSQYELELSKANPQKLEDDYRDINYEELEKEAEEFEQKQKATRKKEKEHDQGISM